MSVWTSKQLNLHARQSYKFCTLQDEWIVGLCDSLLASTSHPNKWSFVKEKDLVKMERHIKITIMELEKLMPK